MATSRLAKRPRVSEEYWDSCSLPLVPPHGPSMSLTAPNHGRRRFLALQPPDEVVFNNSIKGRGKFELDRNGRGKVGLLEDDISEVILRVSPTLLFPGKSSS